MTSQKHNNKDLGTKVKTFFQGNLWKKILTFLFFLLLAFGFWILQSLQQPFEMGIDVPVHYTNIPKGIILNNNVPAEIKVTVKDKGAALLKYTVGKKKYEKLEIDLAQIDLKKSVYTVSSKELATEISNYLSSNAILVSSVPDFLTVEYQALQKKEFPVALSGKLTPAPGYLLTDTALFTPSKVYAYGAKNMLDSLSAIYTENVSIEDIHSPVKKRIKLIAPKGINLNRVEVELNVSAEEFTEKIMQVPVTCRNLPPSYKIHIFPSTVEVITPVVLADYGKIDAIDFEISIDYLDLIKNQNYTTNVILTKKPDWIKSYRINPEKVEFLIEQKSPQ